MNTPLAKLWLQTPVLTAAKQQADEAGIHSIWEWIEDHSLVAYPVLALAIIGLIGWALVSSWRSQALSAEQKIHLKGQIMAIMRRRVSGVSPEAVAAELQIDVLIAASLLSQLAEEGAIAAAQNTSGADAARYRLKGMH